MSSQLQRSRAENYLDGIQAADEEVARLLASEPEEVVPPPVWHRKALGGLTPEQALATRPVFRRVQIHVNPELATESAKCAREMGMHRAQWARHLMAMEVIRQHGGDYDALVGGFVVRRPRDEP